MRPTAVSEMPPGAFDARVTAWLQAWRDGDDAAIERVMGDVYAELRRLAAHYLRGESQAKTLQPTALVHEAYMRMAASRDFDWQARSQFVGVMAQMMRRILVDHARRRRAAKRNAAETVCLESQGFRTGVLDVLTVDEALQRLALEYPRQAAGVELRFFGELSTPEIARTLNVSSATVERDWRFARAWLHGELSHA
jgi:RNA polymerase sigma factor (TIGR02999 family)